MNGLFSRLNRSTFYGRSAVKMLAIGARMAQYFSEVALINARVRDPDQRRRAITENVQKTCQAGLDILGFEVEVIGYDEKLMRENTFLIVGNHMSYMDILVFASVQPTIFVTSVDMGQVPLLGQLAGVAGSIFVERRNRDQVDRDLSAITEVLKHGFHVLIYPEGTSTNGRQILPFKKSLLMAAVEAAVDILPIVLKYTDLDGVAIGPENCDEVTWHGDMGFAPHLLNLTKKRQVKARLEFLKPIQVTPQSTRQELAEKSYNAVHAAFF